MNQTTYTKMIAAYLLVPSMDTSIAWNDERCYIDWVDDLDLPVYFICQFSKLISIMTHLKLSMINSPGPFGRFSKKSNKNLVKILMQVVIVDPYYVKSFMLGQKSKRPYLINNSA